MTKLDLQLLNECEKGYIIGLFLGDGSFNKGRKIPRYIVRFALDLKRDQDISARLYSIFQKGGKQISMFPKDTTLIVKVCSKELVNYIQTCVEYKRNRNNQIEKKLRINEDWSRDFRYGILAGIIDSDGHVHSHLGTEIKTVSPLFFEGILQILTSLGMKARTKVKKATEGSYSNRDRHIIYISSIQMKTYKNKIHSVKMQRFLQS